MQQTCLFTKQYVFRGKPQSFFFSLSHCVTVSVCAWHCVTVPLCQCATASVCVCHCVTVLQLMEINESPIYVLLNPAINPAAKDLPVTVYESGKCLSLCTRAVSECVRSIGFVRSLKTAKRKNRKKKNIPVCLCVCVFCFFVFFFLFFF